MTAKKSQDRLAIVNYIIYILIVLALGTLLVMTWLQLKAVKSEMSKNEVDAWKNAVQKMAEKICFANLTNETQINKTSIFWDSTNGKNRAWVYCGDVGDEIYSFKINENPPALNSELQTIAAESEEKELWRNQTQVLAQQICKDRNMIKTAMDWGTVDGQNVLWIWCIDDANECRPIKVIRGSLSDKERTEWESDTFLRNITKGDTEKFCTDKNMNLGAMDSRPANGFLKIWVYCVDTNGLAYVYEPTVEKNESEDFAKKDILVVEEVCTQKGMNTTAVDWATANGQEQAWIFCVDNMSICHAYEVDKYRNP
jgi:Tfp pilus assembly protein PilX